MYKYFAKNNVSVNVLAHFTNISKITIINPKRIVLGKMFSEIKTNI